MRPLPSMGTFPRLLPLATAAWALAGLALATVSLAGEPPPAQGLPLSETTSLLTAMIKVIGALIVVVGLMLLLLHFLKRTGLASGGSRRGSAITVLETRMVAPKKYIAIVEIAGHCLALGITDHTITRLTDLGPEAKDLLTSPPPTDKPGGAFAGLLNRSLHAWRETASPQGAAENKRTPDPEESP